MYVELVELLRCPHDHEESQLVASAFRTENRHIMEGELGCPVCRAEFAIRDGVLTIGDAPRAVAASPSADEAMRLAAFLDLTDARGYVLLCGGWGAHAAPLRQLSPIGVVLVNPPADVLGDAAAVIVTPGQLPLAPRSARGAAVDSTVPEDLVRAAVRAVRAGGRVIGDAGLAVPAGVTEIARDERAWVGEKVAAPGEAPRLVTLKRAGG